MVNGFPAQIWKRLEAIEAAIRFREPRLLITVVPVYASTGAITAEGEAMLIEYKRRHAVTDDDLVVLVSNYVDDDPEESPQLACISSCRQRGDHR